MVVHLRGDEDFAHEFALTTDDAMSILQIKRSRLTQISGKELRVGKKRVDRYVRPVYRQCDIQNYLEWTRPTASHRSSSEALKEAGQSLNSEIRKNFKDIEKAFASLQDELFGHLKINRQQLTHRYKVHQDLNLERSEANKKWNQKRFQAITHAVTECHQAIAQLHEKIHQHQLDINSVLQSQGTLTSLLNNLSRKVGDFHRERESCEHTLHDKIEELEKRLPPSIPKPAFRKQARLRRTFF